MTEILDIHTDLRNLADTSYKIFQSKLVPEVDSDKIIGVRIPVLRKFAKQIKTKTSSEAFSFLHSLPHETYDENVLHSLLLNEIKDAQLCMNEVERFLPYIDNWAVCDTLSPKAISYDKPLLLDKIRYWTTSSHVYTCRFGMAMLMRHFLGDAFQSEYLDIPASVHSDEYYVNMMIAWFFATALAKQWNDTIRYIEQHRLSEWTHRKAIQKAIESYRITDKQKEYLRTLK